MLKKKYSKGNNLKKFIKFNLISKIKKKNFKKNNTKKKNTSQLKVT
jgi:hypothetical protein